MINNQTAAINSRSYVIGFTRNAADLDFISARALNVALNTPFLSLHRIADHRSGQSGSKLLPAAGQLLNRNFKMLIHDSERASKCY
jgi:hypothetical protein